jgi:hypothetical protein
MLSATEKTLMRFILLASLVMEWRAAHSEYCPPELNRRGDARFIATGEKIFHAKEQSEDAKTLIRIQLCAFASELCAFA